MRDKETGSCWLHFTGECVMGRYAGHALALVPTSLLSWRAFRTLYPQATVIGPTNPLWRRLLGRIISNPPVFVMPGFFRRTMREPDRRLPESELGLGLVIRQRRASDSVIESAERFYPRRPVRGAGVINDRIGDIPVMIASDPWSGSSVAFVAVMDGRELHFRPAEEGLFLDETTGTLFDLAGRGVRGPLQGRRLHPAPSISARWYGFVTTYPRASIWIAGG